MGKLLDRLEQRVRELSTFFQVFLAIGFVAALSQLITTPFAWYLLGAKELFGDSHPLTASLVVLFFNLALAALAALFFKLFFRDSRPFA